MKFPAVLLAILPSIRCQCGEVCFPGLECFDNCPPFDEFPLPGTPESINTSFRLYTRSNRNNPENISDSDLGSYQGSRGDTKFLTHGLAQSGDQEWILQMKNELLNRGDHNVVIIDWADGALPDPDRPLEPVHVANTRVVGRQTRNIARAMRDDRGLSFSDVHCTGFSLGAQVCAFFGKDTPGLRRITGLDPVGNLFDRADTRIRLAPSDASFVDVIHTHAVDDEGPAGMTRECGDVDFWPNQGRIQPGCEDHAMPGPCSHVMALDYFMESINSGCPFTSRPCPSDEAAKLGQCGVCSGEHCQNMGYNAESRSPRGNFLLETNASPPHCQN